MALYEMRDPPQTLADKLRSIPPGLSLFIDDAEHTATSVRSTLSRIRRHGRNFTTKPEGSGLRIWRLS